MKTLINHTLIYDSECPMCDLYTKSFVKSGMLDDNGRVEYGCASVPVSFNNGRARNEIALIDYETGSVTYGIDSLVKVLGHSFPFVTKAFRYEIVRRPLQILYSFISYNRKVIAPPNMFEKRGSCTPSYHVGYRIAYIIFALIVTSVVLAKYTPMLSPYVPLGSFYRELIICSGQILFQAAMIRVLNTNKVLHYIGNMMTVSLIGALLLLPLLTLRNLISIPSFISLGWFVAVVNFMLSIHWKRVKMLGLPYRATVTWICYRLIVLCIILI